MCAEYFSPAMSGGGQEYLLNVGQRPFARAPPNGYVLIGEIISNSV